MKILSLFDGISCGRIALEKAGITVDNYYSSEIDRFAMQISEKNYPDIKQLGDIKTINLNKINNIDLLIGGSPCQDLSFSNEERLGLEGKKSNLFWDYVRILKTLKPKYFLLENVRMEKKWEDVITKELGVEAIKINSALVSAQSRNRLYWTNIPNITQPTDLGIELFNIIEKAINVKYFYALKSVEYLDRNPINRRFCNYIDSKKSTCVTANFRKGVPYNVFVYKNKDFAKDHELMEFVGTNADPFENVVIRKLTPIECERLQTLPDNYTAGVSDTQRYNMIGNGWTVDIVAHIFKNLK